MRHTSYLEVLQRVLVENVFNIHGFLASLLGAAIWAFTVLYHSSAEAADAPQVTVRTHFQDNVIYLRLMWCVIRILCCIFRITWCIFRIKWWIYRIMRYIFRLTWRIFRLMWCVTWLCSPLDALSHIGAVFHSGIMMAICWRNNDMMVMHTWIVFWLIQSITHIINFTCNVILSRRYAKKKGSEVILHAKPWLHYRQKETTAISKTRTHFQNKTSESATQNVELERLRFENRVSPRTHSESLNTITVHSSPFCDTLPSVE